MARAAVRHAADTPARPLPDGPVVLSDGRRLYRDRDISMEVAPGVFQDARHWFGPKGLSVIAEIAQTVNHGLLLHVSLAYRDRLPAWRDIRVIREAFFPPDIDAMMVLPRQSDYVNAHPYCFHIWETPTEWALQ